MLMELRDAKTLPKRYLEIAIVVVSKLNECHYCVAHHKPFLEVAGLSSDAIDSLLDPNGHPELDEIDRLVVEYATQAWESPNRIRTALFDRLRVHFSEAQIVELTLRITLCGFFNRFNDAMQIEEETDGAGRRMSRTASLGLGTLSVCSGFLIWYLLGALDLVSPDLLATPAQVFAALVDIAQNGYPRNHAVAEYRAATLGRCLAGFVLAVLAGVPLGLWMGTSRIVAGAAGWMVQFMRPLPPLSYLVLLILWFGAGDLSKIVLLFLAAFPTITVASMAGVRQVSTQRVQAALSLGATRAQVFRHVVFPSALSMIFTGLRIALAGAFSSVVAAELMAASDGLGWMVFSASRFLRNDIILLGIIILGLCGMVLSRALLVVDTHLVHWRGRDA